MNDKNTFGEYQRPSTPYPRVQGQAPFPTSRHTGATAQATLMQRQQSARTQSRKTPTRMPKAAALALLRKMKHGIVVASILSFGTFSALAMSHTLGTTTQQATTATIAVHKTATVTTKTKKAATTTPAATTTKTVTATPTATTTTTQQGGGYGFGSSSSTSQPVSGTHTS